jgi:tRNA G10  N-methylase Trm11
MIRSENIGFFCQLLKKRTFTEKNLNKGELRPELAFLLCSFAKIEKGDLVCDPFAGFGSIPIQAKQHFAFQHFFVNDIDQDKMNRLKNRLQTDMISISYLDITHLKNIGVQSLDKIITDPPWGYYENISDIVMFYKNMFRSFSECLSDDGQMIILSARKQEMEQAAEEARVDILEKINTLVNGKKASVYRLQFIKPDIKQGVGV